jgi:cytochrome bd-type quinol oxidase subunit 2
MNTPALIALLLVVVLNVWATALVFAADDLESTQRRMQTALVWFAPILGAVAVLLFRWSSRPGKRARRSDTEHEHWQNAQDKAHGVE